MQTPLHIHLISGLQSVVVLAAITSLWGSPAPPRPQLDVERFVSKWYVEGIPYREARAYGPIAVPRLLALLGEPRMEPYQVNVITTLGFIGDSSATSPLLRFLTGQRGEISNDRFQALLAVLPALGHIAQGTDRTAFRAIVDFAKRNPRRGQPPRFSYQKYRGELLVSVIKETAIQALGISGQPDARRVLEMIMRDANLSPALRNNVQEALDLNRRVQRDGPDRVFGQAMGRLDHAHKRR